MAAARLLGPGGDRGYGDRVLQPVGPLPASVYWRRRAVALAVVLGVLLLGWLALPGGGDSGDRQPTAGAAGLPTPSGSDAPPSLSATPPTGDPGRAGDGSGVGAGTGPATGTVPAATTAPAPSTGSPAAPEPCPDSALSVTLAPERPVYQVGESPVLDLQVRNVSDIACARDLGAAQQEILLYRGTQRLWSSNDCYPEGERRFEVLAPGAGENFSVTWSGLSSRPKCAGERTRVGAGSYTLVGRLGTLVSERSPITLR